MKPIDLKMPTFMENESVESLKKIRENNYDYKNVEKSLNELTEKMLEKSNELKKSNKFQD